MCPVSKDKRLMKMFVKKEQAQNEMSLIARLNMYWEIREGFLCLVPLFNLHKQHKDVSEIAFMFLPIALE
jgi:hypothetical protein